MVFSILYAASSFLMMQKHQCLHYLSNYFRCLDLINTLLVCQSVAESLLKAIIRQLQSTLVASAIPMLSCHYLCRLINHILQQSTALCYRQGYNNSSVDTGAPMQQAPAPYDLFHFTPTLYPAALRLTQRTLSKHQPQKRRRAQTYIQEMLQCSELWQIGIVTVPHFRLLCFTVPLHQPGRL